MSNDVQSHEELAAGVAADDRRGGVRHAARSLGSVTARIIGGSQVDLVNFSSRGVLFECDSRLLIGARASVRITTTDANLVVTGRVVRSRVKGLVNGALRYDAALVLDKDLALAPAVLASAPAESDDDLVAFESDLDPTFDPSPVEAYLAESEASLLEVAHDELPLDLAAVAEASQATEETSGVAVDLEVTEETGAVEMADPAPETVPGLHADPVADGDAAVVEAGSPQVEAEPVAFEDDGDIAFEPAVEFAFDESGDVAFAPADAPFEPGAPVVEPSAGEEPAGSSMFDATYIPPVYETEAAESQFEVTVPVPVPTGTSSSFFDAQPSETYGAGPADAAADVPEAAAGTTATDASVEVVLDASDSIDFESEVAFEAADAPPTIDEPAAADALDASPIEAACDDAVEHAAAGPDTDDRVLLQFAATVPHDLAELRRIAADNQW